jgi:hypothetical protein
MSEAETPVAPELPVVPAEGGTPSMRERNAARYLRNRVNILASQKAHRAANRDAVRAANAAYRAANKDTVKASRDAWRTANPLYKKRWDKENLPRLLALVSARKARRLQATPSWANEFFITEAYDLSTRRSESTGIKWHVDHVVPLMSKLVCGLHVENNLRVITKQENLEKGNRFWPDMPEPLRGRDTRGVQGVIL